MKKFKPHVVFGMLNNKDINSFLKIIKSEIKYILALKIPNENNAFETNIIANKCRSLSINCEEMKNMNMAINYINNSNNKIFFDNRIFVFSRKKWEKFFIN